MAKDMIKTRREPNQGGLAIEVAEDTGRVSTLYQPAEGLGSDGHVDETGIKLYSAGYQHFGREQLVNIQAHLRWCDYCSNRMEEIVQQRIKDAKSKPAEN